MLFIIPLFVLLYSCTPNIELIKEGISKNPQIGFYIKDVPFFPQEDYYCGPASLASIINFYGITISVEDISKEIYNPELKGSLSMDILRYARTKGFIASYYKGSMENIKKELSMNRPVIMFLDLGFSIYPVRHYVVAVGYNDDLGYIIAHSGKEHEKLFDYKEVQTAWGKTGFGTILILPKTP